MEPDNPNSSRLLTLSADGRNLARRERDKTKDSVQRDAERRWPAAWETRESLLDLKTGSPETRQAYARDLLRFFCWALDVRNRDPLTLEQGDLVAYLHDLEAKPYSLPSIRRHFSAISSFYRQAITIGHIQRSPVANIPFPKRDTRGSRAAARAGTDLGLDAEQAALLLEQARGEDPGTRMLLLLLLLNGLRVSEACAVRVEDVLPLRRGARQVVITGKGGRTDLITLPGESREAVERAIAGRRHGPLCLRRKKNGEEVAFNRNSARRAVVALAERARMDADIWPHRLRHTFVSLAIDGGVPLQMVSRHARHSSLETTMRYARAMGDADEHSSHTVLEAVQAAGPRGNKNRAD